MHWYLDISMTDQSQFKISRTAHSSPLTGAPRLLQSIAKDETIPFLKPMAVLSKSNEPTRALFVTLSICQLAVLIGNVDAVAPLLRYLEYLRK